MAPWWSCPARPAVPWGRRETWEPAEAAINRGRVALAHDLIARTDLGMEQVAERAGFGSARHMRRVWRQFHPAAPSRLRETSCP